MQPKRSTRRKEENFRAAEIPYQTKETFFRFQEAFRLECRKIARLLGDDGIPPSEYLHKKSGIASRQANNIIGRKQGVTLKTLWPLLLGPHGEQFHEIFLRALGTEWAKKQADYHKIIKAKQRINEAQQELKDLEALS